MALIDSITPAASLMLRQEDREMSKLHYSHVDPLIAEQEYAAADIHRNNGLYFMPTEGIA